jgi:hypothetical protein
LKTSPGPDLLYIAQIATHSLKTTPLAWCARFGLSHDDRRFLGYHVSQKDQTMLHYSRDEASGPLRNFARVVKAVRSLAFLPDLTKSGYFRKSRLVRDAEATQRSQAQAASSAPSANASAGGSGAEVELTVEEEVFSCGMGMASDSSSSSGDSDTDPDDAEAQRVLHEAPVRTTRFAHSDLLFRHPKSGTLHKGRLDAEGLFVCGRSASTAYHKLDEEPEFEWPRCIGCFRQQA